MNIRDAFAIISRDDKAVRARSATARLSVAALALACTSCASVATVADGADLILTNARVYTVEADQPWAEAVAIRDGRIVAVGTAAEIARTGDSETRVVDLGGRLLMPSFGDAHNHPLFGATSRMTCSIAGATSVEEYVAGIAKCAADKPGTGLLYAIGWTETVFPGNAPRKEMLDAISRDRPIVVGSGDGHSIWLNSAALALAGITRDTPDPTGGRIARDPATGEPTGALYEEGALALIEKHLPPPGPADLQNAILYTMKHFHGLGITSWRDAGVEYGDDGTSPMVEAYRAVRERGALALHVVVDLKWKNERGLDQIPALVSAVERAKGYGINAASVKYYLDGVIPQKTAAMIEPYVGTSERGASQILPAVLAEAIARLEARGIQAHVHAIGDRAVRESLDAFAAARARNGAKNVRHLISHLNVIDPADQPRFGQLNAYAVFQPTWASNYDYMDLTKEVIGPKRSQYIYPAGSVLRAGGKLAYGADWPVATANPLEGIEVAVTRTNALDPATGPLLPAEGITVAQAVAAHTINVAETNHIEDQTGSIAPGKSADLIVLDRDIFAVPVTQISDAKVLLTLFGGKPVFGNVGSLSAEGAAGE